MTITINPEVTEKINASAECWHKNQAELEKASNQYEEAQAKLADVEAKLMAGDLTVTTSAFNGAKDAVERARLILDGATARAHTRAYDPPVGVGVMLATILADLYPADTVITTKSVPVTDKPPILIIVPDATANPSLGGGYVIAGEFEFIINKHTPLERHWDANTIKEALEPCGWQVQVFKSDDDMHTSELRLRVSAGYSTVPDINGRIKSSDRTYNLFSKVGGGVNLNGEYGVSIEWQPVSQRIDGGEIITTIGARMINYHEQVFTIPTNRTFHYEPEQIEPGNNPADVKFLRDHLYAAWHPALSPDGAATTVTVLDEEPDWADLFGPITTAVTKIRGGVNKRAERVPVAVAYATTEARKKMPTAD